MVASEVAADLLGIALGGIPPDCDLVVLGHGGSQGGELSDVLIEAGQLLGQLAGHVGAGSLPGVADPQDLADLGQGEPGDLAAADELQSGEGLWWIVAVPVGTALGRGSSPCCS
ncbi:hypothetical protein AUQ48_05960 [Kocuria flava]|uniref:Uncharacterized protein n=1 Tax=Kocuria flava TaxID=446860 RepID=A0A2N4T0V8_9MICC|nr:hypothetical protein AUQ48_05960 [Kocuria flava]